MINHTSREEINSGLYPEGDVFRSDVIEQGPHTVDADKTIHTEGRWEYPGQDAPVFRYGEARPGDSRDEQEWHRSENKQGHAAFSGEYKNRQGHGEEDAGQQIRYHKGHQIP